MIKGIPRDQIRERQESLKKIMKDNDTLVLVGNHEVSRNRSSKFPFRQDSNFWYFTGFDYPDCIFVASKNSGKLETVLVIPIYTDRNIRFNSERKPIELVKSLVPVDKVVYLSDLEPVLRDILNSTENLYFDTLYNYGSANHKRVFDLLQYTRYRKNMRQTDQLIARLRLYKSEWELEQLRRSAQINQLAFINALEIIRNGRKHSGSSHLLEDIAQTKLYEYQIEAEILNTYKQNSLDPAFTIRVASGHNSSVFDYHRNYFEIEDKSNLLIKAGCEYNYYCNTISRTVISENHENIFFDEIYNLVKETNKNVIDFLSISIQNKEGVSLVQIEDFIIKELVEGLLQLNILKGGLQENLESKYYDKYIRGSQVYWTGLDPIDSRSKYIEMEPIYLTEGMTFGIRPGLYFDQNEDSLPPQLRGFGVRIEDNIVYHLDRVEVLTDGVIK